MEPSMESSSVDFNSDASQGETTLSSCQPEAQSVQQVVSLDGLLLRKAFEKVFPDLTKMIHVEDYLDHLVSRQVINMQHITAIQAKGGSQEKAREMLIKVCSRDGGCMAMLDLFTHHDIAQRTLQDKVLQAYEEVSKEPPPPAHGLFSQTTITTMGKETGPIRETNFGKYAEYRIEVIRRSANLSGAAIEENHTRTVRTTLINNELEMHRELGIVLQEELEGDKDLCLVSLGLSPLASIDDGTDFEWVALSNFVTKVTPNLGEDTFHCYVVQINIKHFLSPNHKKLVSDKLTINSRSANSGRTSDKTKCVSSALSAAPPPVRSAGTKTKSKLLSQKNISGSLDLLPSWTAEEEKPESNVQGKSKSKPQAESRDKCSLDGGGSQPEVFAGPAEVKASKGKALKKSTTLPAEPSADKITLVKSDSVGAVPKQKSGSSTHLDVPGDLLATLRQVKFGVGAEQIKLAREVMNRVTSQIVASLQKERALVLKPEYVGSSFEGAKIQAADEFDVLIILDGKELEIEQFHPQFYTLTPRNKDNPTFKEFLASTGVLDPNKVMAKMQSWVNLAINKLFPTGNSGDFTVHMSSRSGPATTLSIEAKPSSPKYKDMAKISVDLVAAFGVLNEHFVAKPCKQKLPARPDMTPPKKEFLWRKSLSLLEKKRLDKIDKGGGCRLQCLKLLKYMRLREDTMSSLSTYHYKVLVLNECEMYQDNESWGADMLAERFWGLLARLIVCLGERELPHSIDRTIDVFESISSKATMEKVKNRLKRIMSKGNEEIKVILTKPLE